MLIDADGRLFDHEGRDVDWEFQDDRNANFTGMTAIFFVGFVGDFGRGFDRIVGVEFSRHDCFGLGERLPYSGKGWGGFTVPMWVIFDGMKWILSKMG